MRLIVEEGEYEAMGYRFPLLVLLWLIVNHRFTHWWRGEGWID